MQDTQTHDAEADSDALLDAKAVTPRSSASRRRILGLFLGVPAIVAATLAISLAVFRSGNGYTGEWRFDPELSGSRASRATGTRIAFDSKSGSEVLAIRANGTWRRIIVRSSPEIYVGTWQKSRDAILLNGEWGGFPTDHGKPMEVYLDRATDVLMIKGPIVHAYYRRSR